MRPEPQFTPDGRGREHVRLCYAALSPRAITEGARRLGAAMAAASRDLERPGRPASAAAASVV
jgi:DNA-binding transcriptional MocR family regulator